jgi:hypothetical protein
MQAGGACVASFYTNAVLYIFYLGERVHILYICKLYVEVGVKRHCMASNQRVDTGMNRTVSTLQTITSVL